MRFTLILIVLFSTSAFSQSEQQFILKKNVVFEKDPPQTKPVCSGGIATPRIYKDIHPANNYQEEIIKESHEEENEELCEGLMI